jgi:hypothetical protein
MKKGYAYDHGEILRLLATQKVNKDSKNLIVIYFWWGFVINSRQLCSCKYIIAQLFFLLNMKETFQAQVQEW